MERLPGEMCLKIFYLLDHQNLATALQVCRKWKKLASEDALWCNLFKERWGGDCAAFYAPCGSKSWKDAYEVQDRCDRLGLGLKIIREGSGYYLIHQGEIQRYLGTRKHRNGGLKGTPLHKEEEQLCSEEEQPCSEISDKILFFIGDLEVACADAKRLRM